MPANVGPRSTPDYAALAASGVHSLKNGGKAYAGPRDDAFFVDLGSPGGAAKLGAQDFDAPLLASVPPQEHEH